jgi:hypothetical protein
MKSDFASAEVCLAARFVVRFVVSSTSLACVIPSEFPPNHHAFLCWHHLEMEHGQGCSKFIERTFGIRRESASGPRQKIPSFGVSDGMDEGFIEDWQSIGWHSKRGFKPSVCILLTC